MSGSANPYAPCVLGDVVVAGVVVTHALPDYGGPYEVRPRPDAIILPTRETAMAQDLTVLAIPYYTTTNASGGYTAIIGG